MNRDHLSLDRVAALLQGWGLPAVVENTGGHVATLLVPVEGTDVVIAVGPGWFDAAGRGWAGTLPDETWAGIESPIEMAEADDPVPVTDPDPVLAADLVHARVRLAMGERLLLVHTRHPDAACSLEGFRAIGEQAAPVPFDPLVVDVDPGRGWTDAEVAERVADVRQSLTAAGFPPSFVDAVADRLDPGPESDPLTAPPPDLDPPPQGFGR